jgi:sugar lactone lactonase YvrE
MVCAAVVLTAAAAACAISAPTAFAASGTLSRLAGTGVDAVATAPGPATSSAFKDAEGVAVDHAGDVYFASSDDREVFKVTPAGYLTVVAGTGTYGAATAGVATSSNLEFPNGVALDSSGNLYIADSDLNQIYKVTPAGILSVVAGNGSTGAPTAGPALNSRLNGPADLKFDSAGNMYIADFNGNYVEKVTPSGTLSIFAGTGTAATEIPGAATSSPLRGPDAVAIDAAGNVYIADSGNNVVEKVTPAGTLSVFAGNGTAGIATAGTATSSHLDYPIGIAIDAAGDVYISDNLDPQVVEVTAGQLSLIAGNGVSGASTYGGPATSSEFGYPFGIALTPAGGLVLGDDGHNVVDLIGALITAPTQVTAPTISGTAAIGQVLTATTGTWQDYPTSYTYQWQDCNSAGTSCVNIAGATSSTYTVSGSDGGYTIHVVVTATNGIGSTAANSQPTAAIQAPPSPTPTPTPTPTGGAGVGLSARALNTGVSVSGSGGLVLPLVCPQTASGCDADGTLTLALSSSHALIDNLITPVKDSVLARFSGVEIQTGYSRLVSVKLTPAATRYLQTRGIRRVRVALTVHNHLSGGADVTTTQQLWLNIAALRASCRAATGTLTGSSIAQMRLGLTRSQAHRLGPHRKGRYGFERYCLTGGAVRIAYTTKSLLNLNKGITGQRTGRVALALTGNRHYRTHGIQTRMTVTAARKRLLLGQGLVIGKNTWYFVASGHVTTVIKAQAGVVGEIGIANPELSHTAYQQRVLLRHP